MSLETTNPEPLHSTCCTYVGSSWFGVVVSSVYRTIAFCTGATVLNPLVPCVYAMG